jgi:hypothetical protein
MKMKLKEKMKRIRPPPVYVAGDMLEKFSYRLLRPFGRCLLWVLDLLRKSQTVFETLWAS